jgi:hypothetical protein
MSEHVCNYCKRTMECSDESYEENPYCRVCLPVRLALASEALGPSECTWCSIQHSPEVSCTNAKRAYYGAPADTNDTLAGALQRLRDSLHAHRDRSGWHLAEPLALLAEVEAAVTRALAGRPQPADGICQEFGIESRPDSSPRRPNYLKWNGNEWVDCRCGCRYHPDDDSGRHGGAPHVHRCERHAQAPAAAQPPARFMDGADEYQRANPGEPAAVTEPPFGGPRRHARTPHRPAPVSHSRRGPAPSRGNGRP